MARFLLSSQGDIPKDLFTTTEKKLTVALIALGHQYSKAEGENDTIYVFFPTKDIEEHKADLLTGKDLMISIHKYWAAESVWSMLINELKKLKTLR